MICMPTNSSAHAYINTCTCVAMSQWLDRIMFRPIPVCSILFPFIYSGHLPDSAPHSSLDGSRKGSPSTSGIGRVSIKLLKTATRARASKRVITRLGVQPCPLPSCPSPGKSRATVPFADDGTSWWDSSSDLADMFISIYHLSIVSSLVRVHVNRVSYMSYMCNI